MASYPVRSARGSAAAAPALSPAQVRVLDVLRAGRGYASYARLIEALWGCGPGEPADARGALHCMLHRMRRVLGRDALRSWHGQGVRLNPAGFELDHSNPQDRHATNR